MAKAAPKLAPAETPNMAGETMGFLKRVWYEAPETDKAPPIKTAKTMRGSLTVRATVSSEGSPYGWPKINLWRKMSNSSQKDTGYRPTPKDKITAAKRAAYKNRALETK
jgi:hypothetical protein